MVMILTRFKQIIGDILVEIILGAVLALVATAKVLKDTPRTTLAIIGCVLLITSGTLQYLSTFGEYPKILFWISVVIYIYLISTSKWIKELAKPADIHFKDI